MNLHVFHYNFLTILTVSCWSYFNTINGDFVFDDVEAVLKNQDLDPNSSIRNIFHNDFWGTNISLNHSHKSYRPLTVLFYKLNVYVFGSKIAFYFHATSIILYVIVCLTYYTLLHSILLKSQKYFNIAFTSSFLFAIHPVHVEVVSSIVGQADLLCSFMFFITVLFYNKAILKNSIFLYLISIILSLTSVFFKETGITVLVVCSLYDTLITFKTNNIFSLKFIKRQIGLFITLLCLLYIRWRVMNFTKPVFTEVDNPASFAKSFWTRVFSYNYIYFLNVLILIWPQWLCFDWSMGCIPLIEQITDIRILFILIFWLSIAIFLIAQLKTRSKITLLSFIFSAVTFLPASNIFLRVGFVIAERTLFLPSAGFCLLISCGFHRICRAWPKYKFVHYLFFILLCFVFINHTWYRNKDWLNEQNLFTSALEVCSKNAKVHYNIAKIAADNKDIQYAEKEYRRAIELHPRYDQAMNNLGNLLRDMGRLEEAKQLLLNAVSLRPDFAAAWMNLGIVYATLDQHEESERSYLTAIKYRRKYSDCYYNLGNLYLKLNRNEEALKSWEHAVTINPSHAAAWINSLVLLDGMGLYQKVLELGKTALNACPKAAALYFTLANTLGKLEKWNEAEKYFQTAIDLNPNSALYHSNFGVLYHRWGKHNLAIKQYEEALTLNPNLASTLRNLKKIKQL